MTRLGFKLLIQTPFTGLQADDKVLFIAVKFIQPSIKKISNTKTFNSSSKISILDILKIMPPHPSSWRESNVKIFHPWDVLSFSSSPQSVFSFWSIGAQYGPPW